MIKKIFNAMVKYFKLTLVLLPLCAWSQTDSITMEKAIELVLSNNMQAKAASHQVQYQQHIKKTSGEIPKTDIDLMYGQYNSILKDNNISITQVIPFPTVFSSRNNYNKALLEGSKAEKRNVENELSYQVKALCFQAYYYYGKRKILMRQDSLYQALQLAVTRKFQTGEENTLEVTKSTARLNELKNALLQVNADIVITESSLQALLNNSSPISIKNFPNRMLPLPVLDSAQAESNPNVQAIEFKSQAASSLKQVERAKTLPELRVGYFTQTLVGFQNVNGQEQFFGKDKRFNGFQVGIGIPLWFIPHTAQVKAYDYASQKAMSELKQAKADWWSQLRRAHQQAIKETASLEYYRTSGLPMANLIQQQSLKSYQHGEISLTELLFNVNQSLNMQEAYLNSLLNYNQSIIHIEYLIGQ